MVRRPGSNSPATATAFLLVLGLALASAPGLAAAVPQAQPGSTPGDAVRHTLARQLIQTLARSAREQRRTTPDARLRATPWSLTASFAERPTPTAGDPDGWASSPPLRDALIALPPPAA